MRVETMLAMSNLKGSDVAINRPFRESDPELVFYRMLTVRHALKRLREAFIEDLDIVTDPMRHGKRDKVHPPTQLNSSAIGILEFTPFAFGNLGGADWTGPDRTARHQALIKRLAVGVTLADVYIWQALAGDRCPKNHAL